MGRISRIYIPLSLSTSQVIFINLFKNHGKTPWLWTSTMSSMTLVKVTSVPKGNDNNPNKLASHKDFAYVEKHGVKANITDIFIQTIHDIITMKNFWNSFLEWDYHRSTHSSQSGMGPNLRLVWVKWWNWDNFPVILDFLVSKPTWDCSFYT